jgi:hypothetical protein
MALFLLTEPFRPMLEKDKAFRYKFMIVAFGVFLLGIAVFVLKTGGN